MAFCYRQKRTRPVPEGAEIITRKVRGKAVKHARWADAKGRIQTAPVREPKAGYSKRRRERAVGMPGTQAVLRPHARWADSHPHRWRKGFRRGRDRDGNLGPGNWGETGGDGIRTHE